MSGLNWQSKTALFEIEDNKYIIDFTDGDTRLDNRPDGLITIVKIRGSDKSHHVASLIEEQLAEYKHDDVYHPEFSNGLIIQGPLELDEAATAELKQSLKHLGTQWIQNAPKDPSGQSIAPGPYALVDGRIRNVWRLFEDTNGTALVTFSGDTLKPILLNTVDDSFPSFAVPSKLKVNPNNTSPIAGWRVLVKDILDIAGSHTTLNNRAYRRTFAPAVKTAAILQKLQDAGAVIVGKAKLNSFGVWEEPTEYIDYQAPWNPRADRFQSPGGSSTGSAAAVAAYEWLDISIGGDTAGSIMRPALWCGVFGLRPSFGVLSQEGHTTAIDFIETPALLGRDLQKLGTFAKAWYGDALPTSSPHPFTSIIWTTDIWKTISQEQQQLAQKFVRDLEIHLGLKHEKVSFEEEWLQSPPKEAGELSLPDYMVPATMNIWVEFLDKIDTFRDMHKQMYKTEPFLSPAVRRMCATAKGKTKDDRDEGQHRFEVFRHWASQRFYTKETDHPLFVVPIENLTPRYRDEPPNFEKPPMGVNGLFFSPLLEAPELVVPVDEVPYHSRITDREETLPFAVGLVSRPGTDTFLVDTVYEVLRKAGRPTTVQCGRKMW